MRRFVRVVVIGPFLIGGLRAFTAVWPLVTVIVWAFDGGKEARSALPMLFDMWRTMLDGTWSGWSDERT